MTNLIYEIVETGQEPFVGKLLKRTDFDGRIWLIPIDPANSDYQAYLATLVTESAPTA